MFEKHVGSLRVDEDYPKMSPQEIKYFSRLFINASRSLQAHPVIDLRLDQLIVSVCDFELICTDLVNRLNQVQPVMNPLTSNAVLI